MALSPLFDIYDPNSLLDEQYEVDPLTGERRRRKISDLMPEEERQSVLQSLSNIGASGLTGLGWLLDTPGAMVRGTISGLADGDPFRGLRALGQTSDERVEGRELLRQFGMTGNDDTWSNFAAGIAAEVALDPTTYFAPWAMLGKGAYSTAARTASRAGLLDNAALLARQQGKGIREFMRSTTGRGIIGMSDDTDAFSRFADAARGKGLNPDDLLDQPLAGMFDFRIPGTERGFNVVGGAAGDMAARALDTLGERARRNPFTGPVLNRTTAAFDPSVMGEVDYDKQWRNREAFAEAGKNQRDSRQWLAEQVLGAEKGQHADFTFNDPRIQNAIRDTIESPTDLLGLQDQQAVAALYAVPEWKQFRDSMAERLAQARDEAASVGRSIPVANSLENVGFFPSQAIYFDAPDLLDLPGRVRARENPYSRGARVLNLDDVVGRSRDLKTDLPRRAETFRRLMSGDFGQNLRSRLVGANDLQTPGIIDEAFTELGMEAPYNKVGVQQISDNGHTAESLREFLSDPTLLDSERSEWQQRLNSLLRKQADADAAAKLQQDSLKVQLGDMLIRADNQFAQNNVGLFDQSPINEMARYLSGHAKSQANAQVIADELINNVSQIPANVMPAGGAVNLLEAAAELGFEPAALREVLERRLPGVDVGAASVPQSVVADLKKLSPLNQQKADSLLGRSYDSYTNLFKVLALANPAYHTRNAYSGFISSLTQGDQNPAQNFVNWLVGVQAGKGNYDQRSLFGLVPSVEERLSTAPGYEALLPEERIDKFKMEAARNRLGGGLVSESEGIPEQAAQALYPGGDTQRSVPWVGDGGLLYDPDRTWREWATIRGVNGPGALLRGEDAPSRTLNPLIDLHERVGRRVEDANRLGTYISALRQGYSPDAAAQAVFKTQVDYSPQAFTDFERRLKKLVPFYSYTRGIAPLVAENILYRPGGLQGQTIRAVTRASQPREGSFLPEHLRQSAAIALPPEFGGQPAENLQRVINNIDLPYEGLINLFSPGIGNTASQRVVDSLQKTGMNLLGQLNPLIKAPLEMVLNRQLYSGRELSDVYSVLENAVDPQYGPLARAAEQVLVNAPGGSKAMSLARTAMDNRLTPAERALKLLVNNTLGVKITDIDQERTKQLAARNTLNELLTATPGVRTYENLTVPEDVLRKMPEDQRRLYLLYKILQSEAAQRAREKKKAEMDPMEILGVR